MTATAGGEVQLSLTQTQLIWRDFKRHRAALAGGIIIALLYLMALGAEFIAPYDPYHREMRSPLVPPMRVHLRDAEGRVRLPFVYGLQQKRDPETFSPFYERQTERRYRVGLLVRGEEYRLWNLISWDVHLFGVVGEQRLHLFGTDDQGRDLLSRVLFATRLSMSIGLVGVTMSFLLAVTLGGVSGFFGGAVDLVIQRLIEIFSSIPSLPLWMALAVAIPLNWPITRVYFFITVILSLISWPGLAREVRGKFLALREQDFVVAAQLDNAQPGRLIFRYLVPSSLSHIIASGTLAIPNMIIGETALSFLGIGLRPPALSWGVLLQTAQNVQSVALSPWLLLPVVFVVIAALAFNFLGDGIRDAADPYQTSAA